MSVKKCYNTCKIFTTQMDKLYVGEVYEKNIK